MRKPNYNFFLNLSLFRITLRFLVSLLARIRQILLLRLLRPLLCDLLGCLLTLNHTLHIPKDIVEIAEHLERESFPLAVANQIMANLGKQQIRLAGSREIGDTVTGVK